VLMVAPRTYDPFGDVVNPVHEFDNADDTYV
jgi:hypothetical protein